MAKQAVTLSIDSGVYQRAKSLAEKDKKYFYTNHRGKISAVVEELLYLWIKKKAELQFDQANQKKESEDKWNLPPENIEEQESELLPQSQ